MKKDIYIIKNTVNDKVYIGQSYDAASRWLSHIKDAKYGHKINKHTQLIHKAMMKYGIDKFHYEILEYQIENYDEREIYWIRYYNTVTPNGYNISIGGKGTGGGVANVNAIFKDETKLLECISEISSGEKTFANIAKKYGCCPEVICAINTGERYHQDNFIYPLRNTDKRYPNFLLKQIRYSLKYELSLSMKEIATKYNIDLSQLSEINQGHIYYVDSDSYPLRDKRVTDLPNETLRQIINDIQNSKLSLSELADKYKIARTRISNINHGTYYKQNELSYPLRADNDPRNSSLKKFLDITIIKDIHNLLLQNISCHEIANKYNISVTTIYNINNGTCKKYRLDNYTYPLVNKK